MTPIAWKPATLWMLALVAAVATLSGLGIWILNMAVMEIYL